MKTDQIYRIGVLLFLKFNGDEMELMTCGRIAWTLGFRAFQKAPSSDENDSTYDSGLENELVNVQNCEDCPFSCAVEFFHF